MPQTDPSFVLNFFKDQLRAETAERRMFTANCLAYVAAAIGPEHARKELIELLKATNTLESELQMTLAGQIANIIKYMGGEQYNHVLLQPLKVFCGADELIVRNKAIESLAAVAESISQSDADTHLMDLCQELSSDPFFTWRSSGCAAIVISYSYVSEANKAALRATFKKLAQDETPMVRRSALSHLPELCEQLPPDILVQEFARDVLVNSASDDEETVRLLLPDSFAVLSRKLEDAERSQLIVYLCKLIVKDNSWRVRSALAEALPEITSPFPHEQIASDMCPLLFRLIKDPEAETKQAAIQSLSKMLPLLTEQAEFVDEKVVPEISQLTRDIMPNVRREASLHLMEVAPIIGTQLTNEKLVPVMTQVLHDNENETSVALLTSVLEHIEELDLASLIPLILPVILETAGDAHWRVKMAIIKLIPPIAKTLGPDEFNSKLWGLVKEWLESQFAAVREMMSFQLDALVQILGADWATNVLAPQILSYKSKPSYLIRQMTLQCILQLKKSLPMPTLGKLFLVPTLEMEKDAIPNVRIMVAKTLVMLSPIGDPKVDAALKRLAADPDPDVSENAKAKPQ